MPACPHCGFEVTEGAADCPLCGSELAPPGSDPGAAGFGAPDPSGSRSGDAAPDGPLPEWEDPGVSFPESFVRTWTESLLNPARFFPRVPWEGPLARPLLYFLLVSVAGAFFTLWWSALGLAGTLPFALPVADLDVGRGALALVEFFLTPFAALLGLVLWTLILHLFALFLAPERRGLRATARVLCYASGPAVFTLVPFLGPLVGFFWGLVLQVLGLRAAHRTTTGRAVAIVLLPMGIFLLLGFALLVFVFVLLGVTLMGA